MNTTGQEVSVGAAMLAGMNVTIAGLVEEAIRAFAASVAAGDFARAERLLAVVMFLLQEEVPHA